MSDQILNKKHFFRKLFIPYSFGKGLDYRTPKNISGTFKAQ